MLLSKRDNAPTLNSTISDQPKQDTTTDYCSDFYSTTYHHLIKENHYNFQGRKIKFNKPKIKLLFQKLTNLQLLQTNITHKYDMYINKLSAELETKEAQNDCIREQILNIRKDMKTTRHDILLIKEYLTRIEPTKIKSKRNPAHDDHKDKRTHKMHWFCKN